MEVEHLTRNGQRVRENFVVQGDALVTREACQIHFPKHYVEGKLGNIENTVNIIGFYGILIGQEYAVNKTCAKVSLLPSSINRVTVDEVDYLELTFEAGAVVMPEVNLVMNGPLLFSIYDELVAKGKTPWYFNYQDLGGIFDTALAHAGIDLRSPRPILEMMATSRCRQLDDRAKYFRNVIKMISDIYESKMDVIPLRSVSYGATNTTARLLGSYFGEGLSSALQNPSEEIERFEELLTA